MSLRSLREEIDDDRTGDVTRVRAEQALEEIRTTEPDLDYAIALCVQAWCDLNTCRGIGMAMGPIPWTAIVAWCEFHDLDHDGAAMVIFVIRQLDDDRAERESSKQALANITGGR